MKTGYTRKIVRLLESRRVGNMVDNTVDYEESKGSSVQSVEDLD